MIANTLNILQHLIRIPSVNPLGRELLEPPYGESGVTDYLEDFFRSLDVPYERIGVSPGRDNIVARIEPLDDAPARPIVLFDAHQDTVPVEGMTIDPWNPVIDGDRLYGRGACDVKGAMACMLTAFARLAQERPRRHADARDGLHRQRRERIHRGPVAGAALVNRHLLDRASTTVSDHCRRTD